jgi:hypothetical protein
LSRNIFNSFGGLSTVGDTAINSNNEQGAKIKTTTNQSKGLKRCLNLHNN